MKQKRKYSAAELHLLALLPDDGGRISTTDLAKAHYGTAMARKKSPHQTVTWTLRSLAEKAKENNEAFRVCSSKFAGPHEAQHWVKLF